MLHPRRYNRATHRPAPRTTTNSINTIGNTNTTNNQANTTPSPSPSPATQPSPPSPTIPTHANTGYNTYITQANGIRHTIASINPPSVSPPATSATSRNPKPPQPVNQQTTKPRPEEAKTHAQNHQQQHPRHQQQPQGAIQHAVTSGSHTTGGTTLTNRITSRSRHLLHTLPISATETSQRPPLTTGH